MMHRRRSLLCLLSAPLWVACSAQAGVDGSDILQPYGALSGGMVFATMASVIDGINGYDLFWVPLPLTPTTDTLPLFRLTNADGNETQPSVSKGGNGLVFARDDGIHLISTSGRVSRVSDPGGDFKDSLPTISWDGTRVAWVREDHTKPIGNSGFYETYIMLAAFDGKNAKAVNPRPGIIQDAPVFEPSLGATRLAWSEFNARTISGFGPTDYGVWVQDFTNGSGRWACQSPARQIGDRPVPYRCFGQHLDWVISGGEDVLILPQDLLEIHLTSGELTTIWPELITGIQSQMLGNPDIGTNPRGFFPRFPLSASYSTNLDRMVVDGVVYPTDGDSPSLAFFVSGVDGGGAWRVQIDGYVADIDQIFTNDYLFSLATPQLMP